MDMPGDKLNIAIDLHEKHMKKPYTATPESQEVLMKLLKDHKKEMAAVYKNKGMK